METKFAHFDYLLETFLDESTLNFDYCDGKIAYEWTANREPQLKKTKKTGDYEEYICNFLLSPNHEKSAGRNNILVIIGGSGTGKSTTVNHCLKQISQNFISHNITKNVSIKIPQKSNDIIIDFRYFDKSESQEHADLLNKFWRYIADKTRESFICSENIAEAPSFWKWCLSQKDILFHCQNIQTFLYSYAEAIECYLSNKDFLVYSSGVNLLNYLNNKKIELFQVFSAKDMAWYSLLFLIYTIKNRENDQHSSYGYAHLIIDNIDHLYPCLQAEAVDLAVLLASIFQLKVIINIRPLTWVQAVQGQYLIEQKYHYAPDTLEVILSRLKKIADSYCKDELTKSYILKVIAMISGEEHKSNIIQQMLEATSGISIRYGLRNVHNMLQSNIIREKFFIENQKLSVNEIARSFFFGDREFFLNHAFDNIYFIHNRLDPNHFLLKARILDFILRIRGGISKIREIFYFCEKFGYHHDDIKDGLEELMIRTRALLWSAEGWVIKKQILLLKL